MPITATKGVEDTKEFYKKEYANFGRDCTSSLNGLIINGKTVTFSECNSYNNI